MMRTKDKGGNMKKSTKITLTILIAVLTIPAIIWTLIMGAGLVLMRYENGGVYGKAGNYPLSVLTERNIQYLNLREIEQLPSAIDNDSWIDPKTNLPSSNNVKIKRDWGKASVVQINQSIAESAEDNAYAPNMYLEISVWSSQERLQKYLDGRVFLVEQLKEDPRFDFLQVYQSNHASAFTASRGLKSIQINYDGKLDLAFFLQKADELLS
jgi:hypothetical protein